MTYHSGMEAKPITIVETPAFLNLPDQKRQVTKLTAALKDYYAKKGD